MITYNKKTKQIVCTHYIDPYSVPIGELFEMREDLCSKELTLRIRLRKLKKLNAPAPILEATQRQLNETVDTISSIEFIIEEREMKKEEEKSLTERLLKAVLVGGSKDERKK